MTLDSFIRYGSLWTLILGVLSLAFAVRNYRRQVNAQIFFEVAGRYHDMLRSFPVQEWISRLNPKDEVPMSPELTSGVLRYLAIVHFAFVLHELRYLSKDLWKLLQAEHYRTLATPLFVREWNTLRVEFSFFLLFWLMWTQSSVDRRGSIPTWRFCDALLPSQRGDRSGESHPLWIKVVQRIPNFQANP